MDDISPGIGLALLIVFGGLGSFALICMGFRIFLWGRPEYADNKLIEKQRIKAKIKCGITRRITVYENNNMSLSCRGVAEIENDIIKSISFKGMPRPGKDGWVSFFKKNIGDSASKNEIECLLSFNDTNNIKADLSEK